MRENDPDKSAHCRWPHCSCREAFLCEKDVCTPAPVSGASDIGTPTLSKSGTTVTIECDDAESAEAMFDALMDLFNLEGGDANANGRTVEPAHATSPRVTAWASDDLVEKVAAIICCQSGCECRGDGECLSYAFMDHARAALAVAEPAIRADERERLAVEIRTANEAHDEMFDRAEAAEAERDRLTEYYQRIANDALEVAQADLRARLATARADERERCAKVAERYPLTTVYIYDRGPTSPPGNSRRHSIPSDVAAAIRAMGDESDA